MPHLVDCSKALAAHSFSLFAVNLIAWLKLPGFD